MKVSVIVVVYNSKKWIKLVFDSILTQTHRDFEILAVICANDDGSKEFLQTNYPSVRILDPGKNIGFAAANNLAIRESTGEFVQLVNPDLVLESNYVAEMLEAFADPKVAAATGKLLRYNFETSEKLKIIDSTGIVINPSGRARDRGQNQIDSGQLDSQKDVFAVSGAGPMYRRSALKKVKFEDEYFDEDFFMYWEDVDLSWRLNNAGLKNVFVPAAVAYHGRTAGQAAGGYLHIYRFIQHHKKLSPQIRRWNYKNHILMYIKNARHIWHPAFWLREIAMFGYVLVFEPSTLKVLPELLRQIPKIIKKRKYHLERRNV